MNSTAGLASVASQVSTVLVAEDEVLVRLVVADYLRECGFRVLEAACADEAIAVLEADVAVDVVFTDVQMPGALDGFGLARWVRDHRPGTRVILASGHGGAARQASDLCAAWAFVPKPYDPEGLAAQIRRTLASG